MKETDGESFTFSTVGAAQRCRYRAGAIGDHPEALEDGMTQSAVARLVRVRQDNIEADMLAIQRNPGLVKSFFRAPYVAYITD